MALPLWSSSPLSFELWARGVFLLRWWVFVTGLAPGPERGSTAAGKHDATVCWMSVLQRGRSALCACLLVRDCDWKRLHFPLFLSFFLSVFLSFFIYVFHLLLLLHCVVCRTVSYLYACVSVRERERILKQG